MVPIASHNMTLYILRVSNKQFEMMCMEDIVRDVAFEMGYASLRDKQKEAILAVADVGFAK